MNLIIYFLLLISNVYAFVCVPVYKHQNMLRANNMQMGGDYLENLNNYTSFLNKAEEPPNIQKLRIISRNINDYMKTTTNTNDPKLEKGQRSTYMPIPKASFDTIFLNINQITKIYISSNLDRIIFELISAKRYVYYINNNNEYKKMDQLMKLIPNGHKICIINDYHSTMDDPFGHLYCEKK